MSEMSKQKSIKKLYCIWYLPRTNNPLSCPKLYKHFMSARVIHYVVIIILYYTTLDFDLKVVRDLSQK
jgi:hypothetical protein